MATRKNIHLKIYICTFTVCLAATFTPEANAFGLMSTQQEVTSRVEPISFESPKCEGSDETITRKGFFTIRDNAKATLLICHGYSCDKHDVSFIRTFFPNFNVMVFDFRAHGEHDDEQECTLGKEEANDVLAAARFLQSRPEVQGKKLFAYGFSMGAASLIEAQAKQPVFDGLILDCPFASSESVIAKGLEGLKFRIFGYTFDMPGKRLLQRHAFNPYVQPLLKVLFRVMANWDSTVINTNIQAISPVQSIKKINIPCLFIHCINDEKVTVRAVKRIYNGATGFKRLWLTSGRRHYDSIFYHPEEYAKRTNGFLEEVLSGSLYRHRRQEISSTIELGTNF